MDGTRVHGTHGVQRQNRRGEFTVVERKLVQLDFLFANLEACILEETGLLVRRGYWTSVKFFFMFGRKKNSEKLNTGPVAPADQWPQSSLRYLFVEKAKLAE